MPNHTTGQKISIEKSVIVKSSFPEQIRFRFNKEKTIVLSNENLRSPISHEKEKKKECTRTTKAHKVLEHFHSQGAQIYTLRF